MKEAAQNKSLSLKQKEQKEKNMEAFLRLQGELLKRNLSNTENYDRLILNFSASSLALSLAALKWIGFSSIVHFWLLIASWMGFFLTIVLSLLSYQVANRGIKLTLENAEKFFIDGDKSALDADNDNIFRKWNNIINQSTGILFVVSLLAVLSFVVLNIGIGGGVMTKKIETQKVIVEKKSADIPRIVDYPSEADTGASTDIPHIVDVGRSGQNSSGNEGNQGEE